MYRPLIAFCVLAFGACRSEEATSIDGRPLWAPPLDAATREKREAALAAARAAHESAPDDPDRLIWLGRRTAYLGRYREAIAIFGRGIELHPADARMYRHRGHRYITLRRFADAVRDLEHAARLVRGQPDEVEPDGLPNSRNVPTSTLQSNIWYHLGLAYYLQADFANAQRCYRECLAVSKNADMQCAASHWFWLTLSRLGADEEARRVLEPIRSDMDVIENHDYHELLLLYKGEGSPAELQRRRASDPTTVSFATVSYGIASWLESRGERERARELLRRIVAGRQWPAFGHIAAEAHLHW